jgi:hypothetical protein
VPAWPAGLAAYFAPGDGTDDGAGGVATGAGGWVIGGSRGSVESGQNKRGPGARRCCSPIK